MAAPPQGAMINGIPLVGIPVVGVPAQVANQGLSIRQALDQEVGFIMPTTITSTDVYTRCIRSAQTFLTYLKVGESRPAQAPAQARQEPAAPAGAPGVVNNAIDAKNRLRALNGGTPGVFPVGPLPVGWKEGEVNGKMNRAADEIKRSMPALLVLPFNQANYDAAMIAWLNTPANQHGLPPAVFRS